MKVSNETRHMHQQHVEAWGKAKKPSNKGEVLATRPMNLHYTYLQTQTNSYDVYGLACTCGGKSQATNRSSMPSVMHGASSFVDLVEKA
jgi:hypothetical protein